MFINFNNRINHGWISRDINSFIYKGGVNVIVIPEALQVYCILVKHFGFDDSWTSFEKWQYKFKDLF